MKKLLVLGMIIISLLVGCTSNQRARVFGGSATENLPQGQKLVTMTWKDANLWLLTRPMREGETPETYKFKESSNFGALQGTVTVIESK